MLTRWGQSMILCNLILTNKLKSLALVNDAYDGQKMFDHLFFTAQF